MGSKILRTDNNYSLTILRIAVGTVLLAHGLQKALGWFNGFGWNASMQYFTGYVGLPAPLAALVILIESLGSLFLIIGFAGRINAALAGFVMIGAFFVDHVHNGFFMNWFGKQKGEGFEFDILFIAIAFVVAVNGSGAFSVDRWILSLSDKRKNAQQTVSA